MATGRAADDRVLDMIRLRCRGVGLRQIAAKYGMSFPGVEKLTRQVRTADIAESGEPPLAVDRAYWRAGRW